MKQVTININGQLIAAMRFATRKAANNFMKKVQGRQLIFSKAHQYYVSI